MTAEVTKPGRNTGGGGVFLYCVVETELGWCGLCSRGNGLWRTSSFHSGQKAALQALDLPTGAREERDDPLLRRAAHWLTGFSCGRPQADPIPLDLADTTHFSRSVLQECAKIPFGCIAFYQELAVRAGSHRAARAVGQVMRRNRLAPFVPCHRVVGAEGWLTGFGGGLPLKARLLELEGWEVKRGPGEKWRLCMLQKLDSVQCLPQRG